MVEIIAYCGLDCQGCPIYLATRQEDKRAQARMRLKIAHLCNKLYGKDYRSEDINDCDGCHSEEARLFFQCKDCPIRNCARQKKLENCAYCPEYVCTKLEAFFLADPSARTHLEAIRASLL